jgi:bifunctional N-acetylglucosamine-1-phosphate-uridyltransferase/glucosamine-1-phosphate-acetyltransferase GlmU-like protein
MDVLKFNKYTNTTKFILPLLFEDNTNYHILFNNFFINAYIADMANKENDDKIHILFADYPSLSIQKILPEPITEYEYKDGFVLVYSLDPKWSKDYNKIIQSRYSHISELAKDRILSFWEEDNTSVTWGVLYKKGDTVQKYLKKITHDETNTPWNRSKEWWISFIIVDEMLGLRN